MVKSKKEKSNEKDSQQEKVKKTAAKKKTTKKSAKKTSAKVSVKKTDQKNIAKKATVKKVKTAKPKPVKSKLQDDLIERLVTERVGAKRHVQAHVHPTEEKREEAQPAVHEEKLKETQEAAIKISVESEPKQKIAINEQLTVKSLADKMNIKVGELIKKLLSIGTLATINQRLDFDMASLVASEFGFETEWVPLFGEEELIKLSKDLDPSKLKFRAPVVTIMGHVDHGKTSLLDTIRKADVVSTEMGGITQHIGAYKVKTDKGEIVFLDTPGHEAFTAMRARGAQATDIVVLVVAADDGIKPQTVEAIDHAKAAGVPIIVAINKIDLPSSNIQKVKQELANYNLLPEDWGGKTVTVEVSAKQNMNIDHLLEMILLESELLELKANPGTLASGVVIEARLHSQKGPVATLLVQNGTMRIMDCFIAGSIFGKVRALVDDHGHRIKEVAPSTPVEVLGLNEAPKAGDKFFVVEDEKKAREIARMRHIKVREDQLLKRKHITLEDLNKKISEEKIKELKVIIKADVQGSIEALRDSIEKLSTNAITLKVIHAGVGGINESDVILASASDAIIIGFNVRPDSGSEALAIREGVEIKTYRIIYEVVKQVRAALEGLLEPEYNEKTVGRCSVKEVFQISKVGLVCGCYVTDGQAQRSSKARVIRDGIIIYEGTVTGLKRFKDDVKTMDKGYECGVTIENLQNVRENDVIEFFVIEKIAKKLEV
ncbi:MAG: translation initiation factor IF-2 [bacterium]